MKADRHTAFVDEHGAMSHMVSAKSGDGVNQLFYHTAAELAGIKLTNAEVEVNTKVVRAEIVNHPASLARPDGKESKGRKRNGPCVVM